MMFLLIWFYGCVIVEKIHPLEGGYLRRKVRRDRRPGLPIETGDSLLSQICPRSDRQAHRRSPGSCGAWARLRRAIKRDPKARDYRDLRR